MTKAPMSLGTLHGAAVSAALAASVSLEFILQSGDWARVSTPARHDFSSYTSTMYWGQDSIQWAVLGLNE